MDCAFYVISKNFLPGPEFPTLALLTFWMDDSIFWGAVLCIIGCLSLSLTFYPLNASRTPIPRYENKKRLQTLTSALWGQNHPPLSPVGGGGGGPGGGGSQLVGAPSCPPKCYRFSPWLGRIQEAIDWCFSVSLSNQCFSFESMFLSLSLKSNEHILG